MKTRTNEHAVIQQIETREYSVSIDGVVEIEKYTDLKSFFDGLLDAIIDYVEQHDAMAGLSMVYGKIH